MLKYPLPLFFWSSAQGYFGEKQAHLRHLSISAAPPHHRDSVHVPIVCIDAEDKKAA